MPPKPRAKVVVRFSSVSAEALHDNAEGTFDDDGRWGVSVRADEVADGESLEEAVDRLCQTTTLRGKYVYWATDSELAREGFDLVEDPTEADPLHHLVGGRDLDAPPDTVKLSTLLSGHRRPNPTHRKA